jgi:hypothetical protein
MATVCVKDVALIAWRRLIHETVRVQLDSAHILVTHPHMYMRRFEGVLACVHHEAEASLKRDRRHAEPFRLYR